MVVSGECVSMLRNVLNSVIFVNSDFCGVEVMFLLVY